MIKDASPFVVYNHLLQNLSPTRTWNQCSLITAEHEASDGANQFVSLVRQFTDIQALTPEIVAAFIEKVYVHDAVVVDGKKQQEIRVVYNFIGDMK